MDFLKNTTSLLMYVVLGDTVRPGVVIVTGERTEIEEVVIQGHLVGSIYDGGQADTVWAV